MSQDRWGSLKALSRATVSQRFLARACGAAAALVLPGAAHALPPIFITAAPTSVTQNQPYRYQFRAIDLDVGDTITYTVPELPAWLSFDGIDTISGTPGPGDVGVHSVTITASDAISTTAHPAFQITVINVDDPPQLVTPIAPDPQSINETGSYSFSVAPFFADPDGDAIVFAAGGLPPEFGIDPATGMISGQPRGPRAGDPPEYSVAVTASNAGGSAADSFILIINNENDPPEIPLPVPQLTTREDVPLAVTPQLLRAQDEDPGDSLTTVIAPPAAGANYTLDGARIVPAANYSGTLQAEARVRDAAGALSNPASITVEVTAENDAPRARAIPAQKADEGAVFSFDTSVYFSDVDDESLTYGAAGLPPGMTIAASTGVISGTPPIGTPARDYAVDVSASDDDGASTTAKLTTTIVRALRADLVASPSVAPSPSLVGNEATWSFLVKNASSVPVNGATLSAVLTGDVPLTFGAPSDSACALQAGAAESRIDCTFGPLAGDAAREVTVVATASRPGFVQAALNVAISGPLPIESNPGNDHAAVTLDVAERLSAGPVQRLTLTDARGAAAGDLNADGFDDLVVASAGGTVLFDSVVDTANANKRVLAAVPTPLAGTTSGNAAAIADFDGDGDADVVTASAGAANELFVNGGGGAYTAVALPGGTAGSRAVAVADIDGDGRVDIVFANDAESTVLRNTGTSTFAVAQRAGAQASDAVLANLSGDSLPELVLTHAAADAAVYTNAAGVLSQSLSLPTGAATAVAAADFDADGALDLVFGRPAAPALVFLNTAGSFFKGGELPGTAIDVLAADVDGDGDADVVALGANGGHRVYLNDGAARFSLHAEHFVHAGAVAGVAAKLSVDDRIDVAVPGSTAVGVFFNDGSGNFGAGDGVPPAVSLRGEPAVSLTIGESYQDPGATAMDAVDGDLTPAIVVKNPVDTAVVGAYTVTYDVVDSSGNPASATRTVEVKPQTGTGGGGGGAIVIELVLLAAAFALRRWIFRE